MRFRKRRGRPIPDSVVVSFCKAIKTEPRWRDFQRLTQLFDLHIISNLDLTKYLPVTGVQQQIEADCSPHSMAPTRYDSRMTAVPILWLQQGTTAAAML
jgi:hypothetical protein